MQHLDWCTPRTGHGGAQHLAALRCTSSPDTFDIVFTIKQPGSSTRLAALSLEARHDLGSLSTVRPACTKYLTWSSSRKTHTQASLSKQQPLTSSHSRALNAANRKNVPDVGHARSQTQRRLANELRLTAPAHRILVVSLALVCNACCLCVSERNKCSCPAAPARAPSAGSEKGPGLELLHAPSIVPTLTEAGAKASS